LSRQVSSRVLRWWTRWDLYHSVHDGFKVFAICESLHHLYMKVDLQLYPCVYFSSDEYKSNVCCMCPFSSFSSIYFSADE